jgi:hemerythrin-like domain-containing protein
MSVAQVRFNHPETPQEIGFAYPIEFMLADHDHQRVQFALFERLADNPDARDARAIASEILAFLETKLPLHVQDEERDFFPPLRYRSEPDDEFEVLLSLLQNEHAVNKEYYRNVIGSLRMIAAGNKPADLQAFCHWARSFSIFERRHLAWENGAIIPLARKRLTPEDQRSLGRKLAARRGVNFNPQH